MNPILTLFAAVNCDPKFFGLEPWYHFLQKGPPPDCEIQSFTILGRNSDIPLVLLAIVDDLLRIAGMVAVAFVIYGAFQFTTSQGDPEKAARARTTVTDALLGLAIAIPAVAFVGFIGNQLGP